MSYIVMECHSSYAILLDEEGRFLKAANLHYQVGQRVYDPVLMKEKPEKKFVFLELFYAFLEWRAFSKSL